MKQKSTAGSEYPEDWPDIALAVKNEAGWKCVRCKHIHEPESGFTLIVHHLDMNKSNNAWWNIPALCQRCHLAIQSKVVIEQPYLFQHSTWFQPYVAGYYAHLRGLPEDREYVMMHLKELLIVPGNV